MEDFFFDKELVPIVALKKIGKFFNSHHGAPYVFVAPFVLTFLVFFLYPLINTIFMSFQEIVPGIVTFIGFKNYERLMNGAFYKALEVTAIFTFWSVLLLVFIPMILAVLINSVIKVCKNFFKISVFIPAMVSTVVGGVIFRQIFGELDTSFMNSVLLKIGLPAQEWTMSAGTGMFLMVLLAVWRWMGVNMLYYLAGLQNISHHLYESADIDGAGSFKKFIYITLPSLKPVTIFIMVISISAGFKMFEESYVFWQGNSPMNIGLTIVGYLYKEGIAKGNMGLGSATGVILLLIIMTLSLIQLKLFGLFDREE